MCKCVTEANDSSLSGALTICSCRNDGTVLSIFLTIKLKVCLQQRRFIIYSLVLFQLCKVNRVFDASHGAAFVRVFNESCHELALGARDQRLLVASRLAILIRLDQIFLLDLFSVLAVRALEEN